MSKNKPQKRSTALKRTLSLIIKLSNRSYSVKQLAEEYEVCQKTIRRDIQAIEALNIPVFNTSPSEIEDDYSVHYRIDKHWLRPFI